MNHVKSAETLTPKVNLLEIAFCDQCNQLTNAIFLQWIILTLECDHQVVFFRRMEYDELIFARTHTDAQQLRIKKWGN